jgi:hypothetical protein
MMKPYGLMIIPLKSTHKIANDRIRAGIGVRPNPFISAGDHRTR